MPTEQQLQAAINAGYTPQQIKLALAKANYGKPKEKSTLAKAGGFAMDVLNAPSYFAGGAIKGIREGGVGGFLTGSGLRGGLKGVAQGFTGDSAPTVYSELPKALGMREGSLGSKVVGLGGELLTPNIPIGSLFKAGKTAMGLNKVVSKAPSRFGQVTSDMARTLLEKSYRLNKTDIDKLAKAIGAKDEATKAIKVIDYLESKGLKGSTRESLKTLQNITKPVQDTYDSLVKRGVNIDRKTYANALMNQAIELESKADDPATRQLAKKMMDEAELQWNKMQSLTDTQLTGTKTRAFSSASDAAINNPYEASFNEQIGRAGAGALETIAPGSKAVGKTLRGLREASDVVGAKSNTGLGTQLINAVKPSGFGAAIGAGLSASQGQNPLPGAVEGAAAGIALNNPRVLNFAGKTLRNGISLPESFGKVTGRVGMTALRSPGFTTADQSRGSQVPQRTSQTYTTTIPQPASTPVVPLVTAQVANKEIKKLKSPSNVFKSKSSFGNVPRLKVGSFK